MSLTKHWHDFKASEPGRRFLDFYEQRQEDRENGQTWRRVLYIGLGLILTVAGIVFLGMPGPGLLVIGLGLGLIAGEFESMARALDRLEIWLRKMAAAILQVWKRLKPYQQGFIILIGLVVLGVAAYVAWEIFF